MYTDPSLPLQVDPIVDTVKSNKTSLLIVYVPVKVQLPLSVIVKLYVSADNPSNTQFDWYTVFVFVFPKESVKLYVYGDVPPKTVIGPTIPEKLLHFELVISTLTVDIPLGVNKFVDVEKLHNPASVTCIVKPPGPNPVKVTVLSKVILVTPFDPK